MFNIQLPHSGHAGATSPFTSSTFSFSPLLNSSFMFVKSRTVKLIKVDMLFPVLYFF